MLHFATLGITPMQLHARSRVQVIAPVRYVDKCKLQGQHTLVPFTHREMH